MADRGDKRFPGLWDDFGTVVIADILSLSAIGSEAPLSDPPVDLVGPAAVAPSPPLEIVFIDGAVPDAAMLAAGVNPGVRAVILDPARDGVEQIAAYLSANGVGNLVAIAIVSHGADGTLFLGSGVLDSSTIAQYQSQLIVIGDALRPNGGLLLYGCDVARDAAGIAFIDRLSAATGGANVAASSHLVGEAADGGSFTLDVNTGAIQAVTPFTAEAQAAFTGVLPTAINQLYFSINNGSASTPTSSLDRINQTGINGTAVIGSVTDLNDASQQTFAPSGAVTLNGLAVDPAAGKYFFVSSNASSVNRILAGNIGSPGGALTTIASTPTVTTQIQGLALDEPNGNLYFALDASTAGSIGIYRVSEAGGTVTQVVSGFTVTSHVPLQLALDIPDNLVFFTDGKLTTTSTLWVGNVLSHAATALTTKATGQLLRGVAYNSGTIYFTTLNGGTVANNDIYSAPLTITGSGSAATASIGTISTLYAGVATGDGTTAVTPQSITIDPTTGVLYTGNDLSINSGATHFAVVNAGTVTGGTSMITVFSTSMGNLSASINGLAFESTPTIAASGTVTYIIGGAAVTIASTASVTNPSGYNLASAEVKITGGTFAGDGDTLTATTTSTNITTSFSGETLTLSGNDTLAHYQQVLDSVRFASTAADPANGGTNPSRTVSWTVSDGVISSTTPTSTINIHGLPVVTVNGTVSFSGGGTAVTLASGLTLADSYSATLASATVVLGGFISGDTLTVGTAGGLTVGFSGGTLTLSGSASLATYQTALQSVKYGFTSGGDPTGGGSHTTRTLSWSVNDGVATSSAGSSALNVVHTAPTIAATGTITYGAGAGAVALDPAVTVTAPDSGNLLSSATISVTAGAFPSDGDVFTVDTTGLAITASIDNTSGIITLTGTDTVADYQQALRSIAINTSGSDPTNGGANPARTISWVVNDGVASSAAAQSTALGTLCFCAGTLILTPTGEIPVERLRAGDFVLTERGETRRIEWVGSGRVLATRGRRNEATPVIVRKAALADNVPHKDLRVTKGHAFHLDGVLVPVEFLVNYRSIIWDDHAQEVALYHIELETHDVLVANGAPAESYRDDGNRWLFQNANDGWNLPPKKPCARVLTGGPIVDAIWRRLLDRVATHTPLPLTLDPAVHLIADGKIIHAHAKRDGYYVFALDKRPSALRIMSRDAVPAELGLARDFRSLGVPVKSLMLRQGLRTRTMGPDDWRLSEGFYPHDQREDWRWTKGAAFVPAALFVGFTGRMELVLRIGGGALYANDGRALKVA